jgi:hypothetical protein
MTTCVPPTARSSAADRHRRRRRVEIAISAVARASRGMPDKEATDYESGRLRFGGRGNKYSSESSEPEDPPPESPVAVWLNQVHHRGR